MLFPKKIVSNILDGVLQKNGIFVYSFFGIDGKMMVDISGESDCLMQFQAFSRVNIHIQTHK